MTSTKTSSVDATEDLPFAAAPAIDKIERMSEVEVNNIKRS
jgi:hypothetical protein